VKSAIESFAAALGRRLNPGDVRGFCALVASIYLALMIVAFASGSRPPYQTAFGVPLGADFAAFYDAGTLINRYGIARLYDQPLQARIYHQQFPRAPADTTDAFQNAPFLALPLPLLSRLAYPKAYALWMIASLLLYLAGFQLLWRQLQGIPERSYSTALLLALTFMPFMVECLSGGQTSALGFFCFAAVLTLELRGYLLLGGLLLSLLTYKPTLLLLICPMLVITGRWRALAGLALGCSLLTLLSVAFGGWQIFSSWFDTLVFTARGSTAAITGLRTWKYLDVNSFARGLTGTLPILRWLIVGGVASCVLPWLVHTWWRIRKGGERLRSASWMLALAWLPVLNIYVGFYDASLVVLSVMLATEQLYRRHGRLPLSYRLLLVALYLTPWLSQPFARITGVQLYTLVLAVWGLYLLRAVNSWLAGRESSSMGERVDQTPQEGPGADVLAPVRYAVH
jgi:Glycosyltransferase family 87